MAVWREIVGREIGAERRNRRRSSIGLYCGDQCEPTLSPLPAATKAAAPKAATFWHQSTPGSPKASPRPISENAKALLDELRGADGVHEWLCDRNDRYSPSWIDADKYYERQVWGHGPALLFLEANGGFGSIPAVG
jgi:hypothetical protein